MAGFALTVLFGATTALAQDEQPATAPAAQAEPAQNADDASDPAARAARRLRRAHLRAAKRAAAARREAAAGLEVAPPAPIVPRPEAVAQPALPPGEHVAPIDAQPGATIDAMPVIAPVKQQAELEHEGVATAPHGEPGATHATGAHVARGEEHGEGHAETAEHAAEHAEHAGFSVKTFVLQLLNFGVLLFLLIRFGGRALNKSLRARHEQLKGDIDEAALLRDEAVRKFQAQEKRLADLEKEIAALRASIRQDAEREQAHLLEGAQERAKRIQEDMRLQLDRQVKEAESILRAEVASASIKLAEELVRKSMNMDDERRLAREFVAGFDAAGPEGTVR